MRKPKNTAESTALISYANYLYEKKGASAVYEYANSLPKDVVKWGFCGACESETPSIHGVTTECLICGQPLTFEETCIEPCISQEMMNDLIVAYNEAKEVKKELVELTGKLRTLQTKSAIEKIDNVLHWLSKYVSDDDELGELSTTTENGERKTNYIKL